MTKICAAALALVAAVALTSTAGAEEDGTDWKGRTELSYVRTDGNSETRTFSAKLEMSAEAGKNRYLLKASGLYGKNQGEVESSRWYAMDRYERLLTKRMFVFFAADYLKDTYAGYDARVTLGPGAGYDFLKTDVHTLKGSASVLWVFENQDFDGRDSDAGDDTDSYAAGKAEVNYAWVITDNLKFSEDADFSISFEDTDVYFINSDTGLEAKLADNLALGLSYLWQYQHAPPAGSRHSDRTFLASLVVDF